MQTYTAKEAKNRFGEVLSKAATEPVKITKNGQDAVIMIPAEDYEENRKRSLSEFYATWDKITESVKATGATQDEIEAVIYSND